MSKIFLLDSISEIESHMDGGIIISGSHGGISASDILIKSHIIPRIVFFNDAGVGKNNAGIKALDILGNINIPVVCYGNNSAEIGIANDAYENGIVTFINEQALKIGVNIGDKIKNLIDKI